LRFALAVLTSCAGAAAQDRTSIPLQIDVEAPGGCPDAAAFFAQLQKHSSRVREASGDERARTMRVGLRLEGEEFLGVLTVRAQEGGEGHREMRGRDCRSVVAGLAFVAAVIVDPDAVSRSTTVGSAPAPSPRGAPSFAVETSAGHDSPSSSPAESAPSGRPVRISTGAGIEVARGLGPYTAFIPRLFVDLEFLRLLRGAHARVSFGRGVSRTVTTELGTAKINLTDVRFDVCVDALYLTSFQLGLCGLVDGMLLTGQGANTANAQNADRLSIELGLALRPRWTPRDWVSLELAIGGAAPLARYRFYFAPDATAYRLAPVSGFAEFAAGVRFW